MGNYRLFAKRSLNSGVPSDLQFGELAFSNSDNALYIGKPNGEYITLTESGTIELNWDSISGKPIAFNPISHSHNEYALTGHTHNEYALSGHVHSDWINSITYDQQAEPNSPSIGQVWRERSASGLIINEWQWDGTYWTETTERVTTTVPVTVNTGQNVVSTIAIPVAKGKGIKFHKAGFSCAVNNASTYSVNSDCISSARITPNSTGFTFANLIPTTNSFSGLGIITTESSQTIGYSMDISNIVASNNLVLTNGHSSGPNGRGASSISCNTNNTNGPSGLSGVFYYFDFRYIRT